MLSNTKKYAVKTIIAALWLIPLQSEAQIMDFIEEKVTNYIIEKAEDYIDEQTGGAYNKTMSFLSNPIGTLWGSYVEESARRSVEEKAAGLADFDVSEEQLILLRNQYNIDPAMPTDPKTLLLPLQYSIKESLKMAVTPDGNRQLSNLGNGVFLRCTKAYMDSLRTNAGVRVIEDVLCQQTLDSLKVLSDMNVGKKLIEDLNAVPQLIATLNRHPEAVRVYANSLKTSLRNQPAHLIYWSSMADAHRSKLPRKTKLPNPRNMTFEQDDDAVTIEYEGQKLGIYIPSQHKMDCFSAELLNFMPMPSCTYTYGSTTFFTDNLARLIYLNIPMNTKGNSVKKTTVKLKNLQNAIGTDAKNTIYAKMLKKMKLQPATAFLQTSATCLDNTTVKEKQKSFKNTVKQSPNTLADFTFSYNNGESTPKSINVSNAIMVNVPKISVNDRDVKEQEKFLQELKSVKSEHYVMDGAIDGKYPIVMNIICQGGSVTGTYFYSKFGDEKRMDLRGTIDERRYANVKEFDENGVCQGEFKGTIQSNGYFYGQFVKEGKQMTFIVNNKL